jgi:hypothetical protein
MAVTPSPRAFVRRSDGRLQFEYRQHCGGRSAKSGCRRHADPRLQTSGHHHAVLCPQHRRRHRHRSQHAASSPPGVHSLPQQDRRAGRGRESSPRHCRQLCDPQTSIRMYAMANPASPLDVPLHLDVCILAHSKASSKFRRRRLKRGVFRSVVHLQLAINHFVAETNADPKPLVWTAIQSACSPLSNAGNKRRVAPLATLEVPPLEMQQLFSAFMATRRLWMVSLR